jgi:hypothetical protein
MVSRMLLYINGLHLGYTKYNNFRQQPFSGDWWQPAHPVLQRMCCQNAANPK